jgi:adenylate cyclase
VTLCGNSSARNIKRIKQKMSAAITQTKRQTNGKILAVDDAPVNLRLLVDLLTVHGYEVHTAADGRAALALLQTQAIDLILLDVMMPDLDGFEVCRQLRASPAYALLPVVLVTSLDSKDDRIRGLEAGADDFLSKPINTHELLARVRSLMRIRKLYETVETQRAELASWATLLEQRVEEALAHNSRLTRLKRFFSPQLADLIVAGGADDPLKSHRREITVVFLDLRGFTAFAETGEPEIVMQALAEYHQAMGKLVVAHQGTLERFTGDGMMIFFNDPVPVAEPTKRAAVMALAMRDAAAILHAQWQRRGFDLGLGIGIAEGFATVGAIGFDERIDYAAIGTVTNVAARLCAHAQAGEVIISQRAIGKIEHDFMHENLGEVQLRGLARGIGISRLLAERRVGATMEATHEAR